MRLSLPAFVTFEGIEGSGKTTQIAAASTFLSARGVDHVVTREPGGSAVGDAVRAVLLDPAHRSMTGLTELLLYAAARSQHLAQIIEPALAAGTTVLCDRYKDATRAYQGYGRGLSGDLIDRVHRLPGLDREADLTILLDHPVDGGLDRARARQRLASDPLTRYEDEAAAFHRRVREGYLTLARAEPSRFEIVDGRGTVDEVTARVRRVLATRLGLEG